MWAIPYGEVATHIAKLASLKPIEVKKEEKKDDNIVDAEFEEVDNKD